MCIYFFTTDKCFENGLVGIVKLIQKVFELLFLPDILQVGGMTFRVTMASREFVTLGTTLKDVTSTTEK